MADKILNYVSIAFFLSIVIIVLIYRMTRSCSEEKEQSIYKSNESIDKSNQLLSVISNESDKHFLDKYVYQSLPPNNYEYLVNYPNGPNSWGEWSWGNNPSKYKGDCSYSILNENQQNLKGERGINL